MFSHYCFSLQTWLLVWIFEKEFTVVKIDLITPAGDPVISPVDSGDGQNEFAFSAPVNGVLEINLKAKVSPDNSEILNAVKDKVKFTVENIGSSTKAWDAANPGGNASVSGSFLIAKVTFTGLPQNNSDFGRKRVTLQYDGQTEETYIEVFFDKAARNHPGNPINTPNWYSYSANTAVTEYDWPVECTVMPMEALEVMQSTNGNPTTPHYTIKGPASAGQETYNSTGLNVNRKGIDTLTATLKHEKQHRQTDLDWLPGGAWFGKNDQDGDELLMTGRMLMLQQALIRRQVIHFRVFLMAMTKKYSVK